MALLLRKSGLDQVRKHTTSVLKKQYTLDPDKAMSTKLADCDRTETFENRGGKYCMDLNTAGFEAFRKLILENISSTYRNIKIITETDTVGNEDKGIYKIKS